MSAAPLDPLIERAQRPGLVDYRPGGRDQSQRTDAEPRFVDPARARGLIAGLAHARVQSEVGDELAGVAEPRTVADRGQERVGRDHVAARHGQKPLRLGPVEHLLGDGPLGLLDLYLKEIDLPQR